MRKKKEDDSAALIRAAKAQAKARYVLKLYVAGVTPKSEAAIRSVTEICETHLQDRYDLEIIDIYQQPERAKGDQIIAAPTLVKRTPKPPKRLVGNLSDPNKVLVGLNLRAKPASTKTTWSSV